MPIKVDERYRNAAYRLFAAGQRAPAVHKHLEKEARADGRLDWPALRTVQRMHDDFKRLRPDQQQEYALFQWPDSMGSGELPWEASRAALDLLRYRDQDGRDRPTVREVKWFYRLRLAAPEMPISWANSAAAHLAWDEFLRVTKRGHLKWVALEWQLAYQPWRGDDHRQVYDKAADQHGLARYPGDWVDSSFVDAETYETQAFLRDYLLNDPQDKEHDDAKDPR